MESAFYVFDRVSAMDFSRRNNESEIQVLTRLRSTASFWLGHGPAARFQLARKIFDKKIKLKVLPRNENK